MLKNLPAMGSIPGLGRSPGEEKGNILQYSGLENSMDRGTWQGLQRVIHDWAIFTFILSSEPSYLTPLQEKINKSLCVPTLLPTASKLTPYIFSGVVGVMG